mgnify:FL=1
MIKYFKESQNFTFFFYANLGYEADRQHNNNKDRNSNFKYGEGKY